LESWCGKAVNKHVVEINPRKERVSEKLREEGERCGNRG